MRSIVHPGSPSPERFRAVPCQARRFTARLQPDLSVNEAAARALVEAGLQGGYMTLRNVQLSPLHYVIPAASPDAEHAAWYSDTRSPPGTMMIELAGMGIGLRDGEPFLHCHGIWGTEEGARNMGHLLPLESRIAESTEVEAWGIAGAILDVSQDDETNFRLFSPRETTVSAGATPNAVLCTVKPNQDISLAIEQICRLHGIGEASIHGIGSLIGVEFDDGRFVDSYATEVLVTEGTVASKDGKPVCTLDIAIVGMDGVISEGRLQRGANPVCVTFELLIVKTS